MRLQFYSFLLVALAFAQASAATIPRDEKSTVADKVVARDAVPDHEKPHSALVIGDAVCSFFPLPSSSSFRSFYVGKMVADGMG